MHSSQDASDIRADRETRRLLLAERQTALGEHEDLVSQLSAELERGREENSQLRAELAAFKRAMRAEVLSQTGSLRQPEPQPEPEPEPESELDRGLEALVYEATLGATDPAAAAEKVRDKICAHVEHILAGQGLSPSSSHGAMPDAITAGLSSAIASLAGVKPEPEPEPEASHGQRPARAAISAAKEHKQARFAALFWDSLRSSALAGLNPQQAPQMQSFMAELEDWFDARMTRFDDGETDEPLPYKYRETILQTRTS